MRYESSVTSLSWIPSEAVTGVSRVAFDSGLHPLRRPAARPRSTTSRRCGTADRFRFANVLRGLDRGGRPGQHHRLRLPGRRPDGLDHREAGAACGNASRRCTLPDIQRRSRRRRATAGCGSSRRPAAGPGSPPRGGCAGGRSSSGRRRWCGPRLSLTLHADGRAEYEVIGASRVPPALGLRRRRASWRHKSGLTDFTDWYRKSFGKHTPWGDEDSPALVTAVETALERACRCSSCTAAAKPRIEQPRPGADPGPPGRPGHRRLPGPRRGHPGRAGRRTAGRVRARGHARRAGRARGRHPDVHPGGGDQVPGRVGSPPSSSTCPTSPSWPPGTGAKRACEAERAHLPVRRTRLDSRPGRRVRPLRRPHLVRGHRPGRRRRAAGSSWTPAPACAGSPGCCAASPSPAPSSSRTCTGITCTGCRSSRPGTVRTPGSPCCYRSRSPSERGVQVRRRCWPRGCRRRTSR